MRIAKAGLPGGKTPLPRSSVSSATANRPRSMASRARRNVALANRDEPAGIRDHAASARSTSPSASAHAPRQYSASTPPSPSFPSRSNRTRACADLAALDLPLDPAQFGASPAIDAYPDRDRGQARHPQQPGEPARAKSRALHDWVEYARRTPPGPPFVRGGWDALQIPPLRRGGSGGCIRVGSRALRKPTVNRSEPRDAPPARGLVPIRAAASPRQLTSLDQPPHPRQ